MQSYTDLTDHLASGWNTWNTRSVLSFVKLPEGLSVSLGVKEYRSARYLGETLIGRKGGDDEQVRPGDRSWDGSYIELDVAWLDIEFTVQSTVRDGELMILITPRKRQRKPPLLVVEVGMLWNRKGMVFHTEEGICARCESGDAVVYGTSVHVADPNIPTTSPYICMELDSVLGISTGQRRGVDFIQDAVRSAKVAEEASPDSGGKLGEARRAIRNVMAWDTIYDPLKHRVISPVSRLWSVKNGGYVLFDWDTYFAAYLASVDNREIAYANAIAITDEITERGFVPNMASASGFTSRDRSEPPVGSLVIRALYRKYKDRWLLSEVYDRLLEWNRWWHEHRSCDGYLCWGSDPYDPRLDGHWELHGVGERLGAALESGLDNSPMYDDMEFDDEHHLMLLADVGLMAMYIHDCDALAEIATALGRSDDETELRERGATYADRLQSLWSEKDGLFLNKRLDADTLETRLSPTHFYPMLAGVPDTRKAERMVKEHLLNPAEFWGDWVIPSIARNDPAFEEQDYWRGRIWAPMNFLVYLGLSNYDFPDVKREFAKKSFDLLMNEWRNDGFVCENYNAITGLGSDRANSDRYYHWGALLALVYLIEEEALT